MEGMGGYGGSTALSICTRITAKRQPCCCKCSCLPRLLVASTHMSIRTQAWALTRRWREQARAQRPNRWLPRQ
jgi:hypothetical protein